ncbi:MAG TPA: hypothetical protein VF779_00555 [Pyrinomonadaceae bacterium]
MAQKKTDVESHPAVDAGNGCLLGGVVRGKWMEDTAIAPMLKGGERYRLYTLKGPVGEVTGTKPQEGEEPCNGAQEIKLSPDASEGFAVRGEWNAMPRIPQMLSVNEPVYRQVIDGILRRHGFARPKVNLTQVLKVDLDGDGVDEVLISASYYAGGLKSPEKGMAFKAQKGDYSFVVLRKVIGGKVRDIELGGEFYPKFKEVTPNQYEVSGVLDLNGDGKMEVILSIDYYEGSSSSVFRINGTRVDNVFGCGCGA